MRPPAQPRQPRRAPVAERPGEDVAVDRGEDTGAGPRWHPTATTGAAPRGPARPGRGSLDLRERTRRWLPARPQPPEHAPDRPGFLERLAERARAQRRLAWRKVLLAVAVLVVVAAAAWALFLSSLLALDLDEVTVTGAGEGTTVPVESVLAVVEEHEGTPLTRLDTGALAAGVGEITTVRSVTVTRSWPHGLAVDVSARVPVAAATSEDGLVLLDVDGVVVGSVDAPPEGLPRVTVPLSGERAGQTLEAVLTVLAELPADLRAEVATAGATNPASITLELTDGAQVRWGEVEESELKAAVLAVLRERPAAVYDVTVPRSPTLSG